MVYLELVEELGDEAVYDYMPERKNAPRGRVSVNRKTRERKLIAKSSEDELSWYRGHAWRCVCKMLDEGVLLENTYAAWY